MRCHADSGRYFYFIVMSKEKLDNVLCNEKISYTAKGLYCRMLFIENLNDFSISKIQKQSEKDGRDKITNAMNELIDFGYVVRVEWRDSSSKFLGYKYEI